MASPNPERDESHDKADAIHQTRQTQHAQSARDTQSLRSQVSDGNSDHPDCKCHHAAERFAVAKLLLSIVLTVATMGAFAAAAIYACYARQHAKATVVAAQAEVSANRAWIVPSGNKTWMVNSNFMGFEFDWMNAGKTPAVHIRATEEFKTDLNAKFNRGCVTFDPKKGGETQLLPVLLPQQTFPITPSIPGEASAWTEGKSAIIQVHGCIRYVDVLTNSERYTDFCISVRRRGTVGDVFPCSSVDFGIWVFGSDSQKWEPIVFH